MVAEIATRVLPHRSFAGGVGPATAKRTLWAMPRIVRSPSTANSPSLAMLMLLDLKCGSETSHIKEIGALHVRIPLFVRAYESRPPLRVELAMRTCDDSGDEICKHLCSSDINGVTFHHFYLESHLHCLQLKSDTLATVICSSYSLSRGWTVLQMKH
jgi:hypothetical protein